MGNYAVQTKFVELFLNKNGDNVSMADYWGVYIFMEKIRIDDDRVDIARLSPTDNAEPEISGGYIIKHDKNTLGDPTFTTTQNKTGDFQYQEPTADELTTQQKTWIKGYLDQLETALYGGSYTDPVNGYAKYLDVDTFIDFFWMVEITKQVDSFSFSTYMHKDRNGKLKMGPAWDFNIAFGNAGVTPGQSWYFSWQREAQGWYYSGVGNGDDWYDRMRTDAEYNIKCADRWFELREDRFSDAIIVADMDYYYNLLSAEAAARHYNRWQFYVDPDTGMEVGSGGVWASILNAWTWPNYYHGTPNDPHTYQMELEWTKNWLTGLGTPAPGETYDPLYADRFGWIDNNIGYAFPPNFTVGAVPMDTGGSISVGATLTMSAATPGTIYYTLDGTDPRQAFTGNAVGTAYSGGITLNETTQVKARIKDGSNWSALNEAIFSDDRVANSLRITEVMYHPVDPNDEYIEFKNIGPATINLAHCQLTKGVNFTFPSVTLAPSAYTIVVRDTAEFNARYPGYSGAIAGEYTLLDKLDNGGENIRLRDAADNIIQEFEYEDNWFPITDGKGYSINSINPTPADPNDWNKRLSWEASNVQYGTPGQDHVPNTIANDAIVINEILTHTDDPEGDWIELYNTSAGTIDVGNWYLSDNKDNLKKYKIASPTNIPAGGYLVLTATTHFGNAADPGSAVQFGLSEHGEDVFLTSGNGSDIAGGYSDGESFGSSRNDITFGRYTKGAPTFNTDFIELISMTQGAANSAPYVPDVVITEIMYNAQGIPDLLGEYIELHNRDTGTVYLYDLSNPDNTWKFTKGVDFMFPIGASIGAGQTILISRTHPEAFKVANGDPGVAVYGPFASGTELENDGEKIELSMPTDPDPGTGFISYIRVEQVNYSDGIHPLGDDPWPTSADGRGDSLHRTTLSNYGNDVANWSAAAPTPGS